MGALSKPTGNARGYRCSGDAGVFQEFCFNSFEMFSDVFNTSQGDDNFLFLFKTQTFVLHIIDLSGHNDRSGNEYERNHELSHDQGTSQFISRQTSSLPAF